MGSNLIPICNSRAFPEITSQLAEDILCLLKAKNFRRLTNFSNVDISDWAYYIDYDDLNQPYRIEFEGGYYHSPTIYRRISSIDSIYRYYILYENNKSDWFQNYRKELYCIAKMLDATEVIYLNDTTSVLGPIFFDMVLKGTSYEEVKRTLINQLGEPIKDFNKLISELKFQSATA